MDVITYPFRIDYRSISKMLTVVGRDAVFKDLVEFGYTEQVANVVIKQALKRGWGC